MCSKVEVRFFARGWSKVGRLEPRRADASSYLPYLPYLEEEKEEKNNCIFFLTGI